MIGVLEVAKSQSNVAGWIHAKGLLQPAARVEGIEGKNGTGADIGLTDPNPATTTSAYASRVWFDEPEVYNGWVERGKSALKMLGVGLRM